MGKNYRFFCNTHQNYDNYQLIIDKNILTFGKYKGKTFEEVFEEHPDYCDWILTQTTPRNKGFKNFYNWLSKKK